MKLCSKTNCKALYFKRSLFYLVKTQKWVVRVYCTWGRRTLNFAFYLFMYLCIYYYYYYLGGGWARINHFVTRLIFYHKKVSKVLDTGCQFSHSILMRKKCKMATEILEILDSFSWFLRCTNSQRPRSNWRVT